MLLVSCLHFVDLTHEHNTVYFKYHSNADLKYARNKDATGFTRVRERRPCIPEVELCEIVHNTAILLGKMLCCR